MTSGEERFDEAAGVAPAEGGDAALDEEKWPIGFILTIVMVGVYLAYRLIQGVVLLIDWIF